MTQIVICCGGQLTEKDKQEIYNLLDFKERYKKFKKSIDIHNECDIIKSSRGTH